MIRPFFQVSIKQVTPYSYKDNNGVLNYVERNRFIELDFCSECEITSTYENHTDKAVIKFPKNVVLKNGDALFHQSGVFNAILGGTTEVKDADGDNIIYPPLLMRGDIIYIQDGYWFKNENHEEVNVGKTRFTGFVSKIFSKVPIEVECEDNFYLLKKIPVGVSVWKTELTSLLKKIVDRVNENFNSKNSLYPKIEFSDKPDSLTANFSLGYLEIGEMTCSQLLNKLRNQYKLESFFVGNVLHFGFPIYDEDRAKSNTNFFFHDLIENGVLKASSNIINSDDLEYKNKEDIILSTIVSCQVIKNTGKTLRDGGTSTKREKTKVLIYWDILTETFKHIVKENGEPFPPNEDGERHECIYPINPHERTPSIQELVDFGEAQLKKYYYTGFRGSFETIGFPFVEWNDNINLRDPILIDRNGQYKVKKVIYTDTTRGIKQKIFIDFKQQVTLPDITSYVYMI